MCQSLNSNQPTGAMRARVCGLVRLGSCLGGSLVRIRNLTTDNLFCEPCGVQGPVKYCSKLKACQAYCSAAACVLQSAAERGRAGSAGRASGGGSAGCLTPACLPGTVQFRVRVISLNREKAAGLRGPRAAGWSNWPRVQAGEQIRGQRIRTSQLRHVVMQILQMTVQRSRMLRTDILRHSEYHREHLLSLTAIEKIFSPLRCSNLMLIESEVECVNV